MPVNFDQFNKGEKTKKKPHSNTPPNNVKLKSSVKESERLAIVECCIHYNSSNPVDQRCTNCSSGEKCIGPCAQWVCVDREKCKMLRKKLGIKSKEWPLEYYHLVKGKGKFDFKYKTSIGRISSETSNQVQATLKEGENGN